MEQMKTAVEMAEFKCPKYGWHRTPYFHVPCNRSESGKERQRPEIAYKRPWSKKRMMKVRSARLVAVKRAQTSIGDSQAAVNSPSTEPAPRRLLQYRHFKLQPSPDQFSSQQRVNQSSKSWKNKKKAAMIMTVKMTPSMTNALRIFSTNSY